MKVFYFAARFGSLSRAADALYITQPAVTKQIQNLHDYYGIKFLNQFGKKMVLTDAGEKLFDVAKKILEMDIQAEEIIRDFQQLKSGHIKILSSESFGAYYLPFIKVPFNKEYPQIRISVIILPVEEVIKNTIQLNCDVGFVSYVNQDPKLVIKEILEDSVVLIVPIHHPFAKKKYIDPGELDGKPFIMHETGSATRTVIDKFLLKHNISVKIIFELSNNEAVKRAVESAIGLSIISLNVAREEIKRGTLKAIPIRDQSLKRKFYMIHHKDKYFSKPLRAFMDLVSWWTSEYNKSSRLNI
jgi:DNA-binding transcriptional LysR family regulator